MDPACHAPGSRSASAAAATAERGRAVTATRGGSGGAGASATTRATLPTGAGLATRTAGPPPEPRRPPPPPPPLRRRPPPPPPLCVRAGRSSTRPPATSTRSPGASSASIGWLGPETFVVVGEILAARVRSRTSLTCWSVISVMTVPAAPARAVRPERCRYALCSAGGSAWTTSATSSTWMPRAAMSVATSVRRLAGVEGLHVPGARVLREVAVQLDGRHAARVELAGQVLGAVLGAGEHDRAAGCAGQVDQHRDPVVAVHVQHVVVHASRSATGPSRPRG